MDGATLTALRRAASRPETSRHAATRAAARHLPQQFKRKFSDGDERDRSTRPSRLRTGSRPILLAGSSAENGCPRAVVCAFRVEVCNAAGSGDRLN